MTENNSTLTRNRLLEVLHYEGISGIFAWKERSLSHFKTEHDRNVWNAKYSGSEAGWIDSHGYRRISIDGRDYKGHRLAILIFYGKFPENETDHTNGDRADNRIFNLRCVTKSGNQRNLAMRSDNTSGCMGVNWRRTHQKWIARISVDGCEKHLGYFTSFHKAVAVRKAAEVAFGYFSGHGKKL